MSPAPVSLHDSPGVVNPVIGDAEFAYKVLLSPSGLKDGNLPAFT